MRPTRRPLSRKRLSRLPWYRQDIAADTTALYQAIGAEIGRAVDVLAKRMTMNEAMDLATKTADEAGAGFRGWGKLAPIKAALGQLVNPAIVCEGCGARLDISCPMCGAGGRK